MKTKHPSYLSSRWLAGCGTALFWLSPLPRHHRASPSVSLDKKILRYAVMFKILTYFNGFHPKCQTGKFSSALSKRIQIFMMNSVVI